MTKLTSYKRVHCASRLTCKQKRPRKVKLRDVNTPSTVRSPLVVQRVRRRDYSGGCHPSDSSSTSKRLKRKPNLVFRYLGELYLPQRKRTAAPLASTDVAERDKRSLNQSVCDRFQFHPSLEWLCSVPSSLELNCGLSPVCDDDEENNCLSSRTACRNVTISLYARRRSQSRSSNDTNAVICVYLHPAQEAQPPDEDVHFGTARPLNERNDDCDLRPRGVEEFDDAMSRVADLRRQREERRSELLLTRTERLPEITTEIDEVIDQQYADYDLHPRGVPDRSAHELNAP